MINTRALNIVLNKMRRLKFQNCKFMQKYFNQHKLLKLNIIDVKRLYNNSQLISKILRDFTFKYNNFVNQYYFLNENTFIIIKNIIIKFLTYESKLFEQNIEYKVNKKNNIKKKKNDFKLICIYKLYQKKSHQKNYRMKKKHEVENIKDNTNENNISDKNKKNKKFKSENFENNRQVVTIAHNIDITIIRQIFKNFYVMFKINIKNVFIHNELNCDNICLFILFFKVDSFICFVYNHDERQTLV